MVDDPLAKWRRQGSPPLGGKQTHGVTVVAPPSGIRPREYKAYVSDNARTSMLLLKRSLVKKAEADMALPYGYLVGANSDGYGFGFSLLFARPGPWGPVVVEIRGEGLMPLLDGILSATVKSIQLFDPDRFLPEAGGDLDIEADEWRGPCVVKHICVTETNSPAENTTKH